MQIDKALFTIPVNPNNFPAKLWCLVNSPQTRSIYWDSCGETIVIDQPLFEAELLSPALKTSGESPEPFKTTNFTSFIRQLNLYGFRKVVVCAGSSDKQGNGEPAMDGAQHHFHNPNFKRGHPELLVNLKRLTSTNKAKIEAGIEVTSRPPTRIHRSMLNSPEDISTVLQKKGSVSKQQTEQGRVNVAPHPYHSNGSQQPKVYDRTPVPSRTWTMGRGNASSTTHFYTSQSAAATSHKYGPFFHHHPQYRSGFYTEVYPCSTPSSLDSDMTCSRQPASPYSPYGYYPNYAVGYLHPSGQNPDWSSDGSGESNKSDVSLDAVFKIVDELQGSPKVHMVKLSSPDKLPSTSTAEGCLTVPSHHSSPAGVIITVPGVVPSGIAVTVGASSSQSETALLESSQKAAAVSVVALSGEGAKERASDSTTGVFSPRQKGDSLGK